MRRKEIKKANGLTLYFIQFITLSWKNLIVIRRQKLKLIVEILWPVVLFCILAAVRSIRPIENKPACYLQSKAFPSAGMFPFVQTTICTIANECKNKPAAIVSDEAPITKFLEASFNLMSDEVFIKNSVFLIENLQLQINSTLSGGLLNSDDVSSALLADGVSQESIDALLNSDVNFAQFSALLTPISNTDPSNPFCDSNNELLPLFNLPANSNRAKVSQEICSLTAAEIQDAFDAQVLNLNEQLSLQTLLALYSKLQTSGMVDAFASFSEVQSETFDINTIFRLTCGTPFNQAGLDADESEYSYAQVDFSNDDYENDPEFSPFCNQIFRQIEANALFAQAFSYVKPMFVGKILYYPDNESTQKIIKQLNTTFQRVEDVKIMLSEILDNEDLFSEGLSDFFDTLASSQMLDELEDFANTFGNLQLGNAGELKAIVDGINSFIGGSNQTSWRVVFDEFIMVVEMLFNASNCIPVDRFEAMSSEEQLFDRGFQLIEKNKLWAALQFLNVKDKIPTNVEYKIRMKTGIVDSTNRIADRFQEPEPRASFLNDLKPILSGQAYIIDLLEKSIIQLQTGKDFLQVGTWINQFPTNCYIEDTYLRAVSETLPLFMTLAWIYIVGMVIKSIVYEKEVRLKENMKVMGLSNSILWMTWFCTTFIIMMCSALLLIFILVYYKLLPHSNVFVLTFFFVSYVICTISFCFLMSTFFTNANVASACGGLIFFLQYMPYILITQYIDEMSGFLKLISCLLSNVSFGFVCTYFAAYEQQGIGAQWHNIFDSPNFADNFSLGSAIAMLYVDTILYMLLTIYIENVFPGQYGIAKPFYFFLMPSYWFKFSSQTVDNINREIPLSSINLEPEPKQHKIGVSVQNLQKIYSTGKKLAVNDLSLNFFEDQITSFLGHNGAGKTTTMSIITGIFQPTKGTVYVYGKDIRTQMDDIRQDIGTCPQHNVLFDELTVEEHVKFYGRLRGVSNEDIREESVQMLHDLNLEKKSKELSRNLSGGMKRKLSVAIAFVGGNKTVICDEPTAGVDPHSRRGIWDLLLKYKAGRTIILSTHHMDEADILGDRIAIISHGSLKCCGSSLFLKNHYGDGYVLTLSREIDFINMVDNEKTKLRNQEEIVTLVSTNVPGSKLLSSLGSELTFLLPYSQQSNGNYERLLKSIDENLTNLWISGYGLTDTTLEDIFLKIAVQSEEEDHFTSQGFLDKVFDVIGRFLGFHDAEKRSHKNLPENSDEMQIENFSELNKCEVTGLSLLAIQFYALFIKRWHTLKRDVKGFTSQIILPGLFVVISMIFTLIIPGVTEQPSLLLQPWIYGDNLNAFIAMNTTDDSTIQMADSFLNYPFYSTRCISNSEIPGHPCLNIQSVDFSYPQPSSIKYNTSGACDCRTGYPICSAEVIGPTPPFKRIATSDTIFDLTNRSISSYLLKTRNAYDLRRILGYEFKEQLVGYVLDNATQKNVSEGMEKLLNAMQITEFEADVNTTSMSALRSSLSYFFGTESIPNRNIRLWWNNKAHHGLISGVNAMNNFILRSLLPPNVSEQYSIKAYSHPWPLTEDQLTLQAVFRTAAIVVVAICVIFSLSFVPASFVLYLISERVTKSKHLQFVSGVNRVTYWVSTFCWDFLNYFITICIVIFIFLVFQTKAFVSLDNFPVLVCLLLMYAWAITPMMYPAAYLFNIPSTAYVVLIGINVFIGINTTVATFILDLFADEDILVEINNVIKKLFLCLPQYCLGRGLIDMAQNQIFTDFLSEFGLYQFKSAFSLDLTGKHIIALFVQGIVFFLLNVVIEHAYILQRFTAYIKNKIWRDSSNNDNADTELDNDVAAENRRINELCDNNDVLVVRSLSKNFLTTRGMLKAVKKLNFGVKSGECFGLLGVNGAGKTTTFGMLTGAILPTSGSAYICGNNVVHQKREAHKHIGYCPQFDALFPLLTGRELLTVYARIRGIKSSSIPIVTDQCLRKLGLINFADRQCGTYSGGNKRKLSTAIALIGNPSVLFLDEPTSGMDPGARRFLWDCILDVISDQNRSVVLTSHSMEECESLCTRLAIMVNGEFKCFGSPQHIKNKYGDGYTVTLKAKDKVDINNLVYYMRNVYRNLEIKELHKNSVQLQIPTQSINLASLFGILENGKKHKSIGIEDYSISQTTLDQVFISFAKKQTDDEESTILSPKSSNFCYDNEGFFMAGDNFENDAGHAIFENEAFERDSQDSVEFRGMRSSNGSRNPNTTEQHSDEFNFGGSSTPSSVLPEVVDHL